MKIELIIFLIILTSITSGCIEPTNLTEEYSENLKSITDSRPEEFRSQHSDLLIMHQLQLKKNWLNDIEELQINGEARYGGNTTLTYFKIKAQFYDKKGTLVCSKTSNGVRLFGHSAFNQSFDLKVTNGDCRNWGLVSIENYRFGIEYSK